MEDIDLDLGASTVGLIRCDSWGSMWTGQDPGHAAVEIAAATHIAWEGVKELPCRIGMEAV
jgi:hypothetical protein